MSRFHTRAARRGLATAVVIPALAVPALLVVQWPFEGGAPTQTRPVAAAALPAGTTVIHFPMMFGCRLSFLFSAITGSRAREARLCRPSGI